MKQVLRHVRLHVVRGLLAVIPIALSVFAIGLLYVVIDRRVMDLVDQMIGVRIPGLGILLVLISLYALGLLASNVVGRQLFRLVERLTARIPLVKTTYQIGKQLSSTFSLPEHQLFKRAVLVEYLKPGMWTIGFVTGTMVDKQAQDERCLKVFIPTPPNPASGTMVIVRESQTRDPGWTIEEALKTVVSGGIIGPTEFR